MAHMIFWYLDPKGDTSGCSFETLPLWAVRP